jgi:protein-tyrosine phosphatase
MTDDLVTRLVDLHSHVIPGVDDGAVDLDEALAALRAMRLAGVSHVAATPHVDGSLTLQQSAIDERLAEIDAAWESLCSACNGDVNMPAVSRGAEVKLDTPEPDVSDPRLRVAATDFVLVEFPFMSVPPRSALAIAALRSSGYIPIVAHPERYHGILRMGHTIEEWRGAGAYLQVNAGSVLGRYGPDAQRVASLLLQRGWVDYIASDHHSRGRMPYGDCVELLRRSGGAEQAAILLRVNPQRLLENTAPLPVAPLQEEPGLWSRITRVFR